MVKIMIQDNVLELTQKSYYSFYEFIKSFVPEEVIINSTNNVENIWKKQEKKDPLDLTEEENNDDQKKKALFAIDLMKGINENESFLYSTPPKNAITSTLLIFDRVLDELTRIPDIESKFLQEVLKNPQKHEQFVKTHRRPRLQPEIDPNDPPIKKYSNNEGWLWDLFNNLKDLLKKAVKPLDDYLKAFDIYKEILLIDPVAYANSVFFLNYLKKRLKIY